MSDWQLGLILKPFLLLALLLCIWPIKAALKRYLPDSKLKRFLFISWRV